MRFARLVFRIAGIWGLLIVTPLYFLYELSVFLSYFVTRTRDKPIAAKEAA